MNSRFYAQAEVLVEVVRQGSMTAAAAALRLSKSNVSQKIAEIENDLDAVLLKRNTRAIELTPAGKRVFDLCVKAVDALQLARGEVEHELQSAVPQGVVCLSGSNLYLSEFIMPLLPSLRENLPLVRIDLVGGDHIVDQRAEAVDLRIRVGTVDTDGVKVYPLAPLERVLCLHRDFLRDAKVPTDPSGLSGVPLILRSQENPEWVLRNNGKSTKQSVTNPVLRVNSYELCVSAVRSGLGAAVLAKAIVQKDMDDGSVVELLPSWKIDPIPVSLVVPVSKLRRPEVLAVSRYIVSRFHRGRDF
ncbi:MULTISPECIES: LysR family transcriptional regulator [Tritonibacter]|jgi:DNA-binding transcriptional LysR family regulator|uniref:LysR family transcriptional regulator n=2 Tax=Tritonibacter TaxID=2083206 RepID=A0A843YLJ0_9RHOB|nr:MULTISPECIES: LysR family transcriptional regulator [Tritonibacter]KUP91582.1 HTH-type transcriptional regulator DmlR [Tritonibacter horizontis]MQQ10525.1 LysR family transcriptional regulator [Tritonibacter litoralis]